MAVKRNVILYGGDMATPQIVSTTPGKIITLGQNGSFEGVTLDIPNQRIIVKTPGKHLVFAQISFGHSALEDSFAYTFMLYKNGQPTGFQFSCTLDGFEVDGESGTIIGVLDLEVNDMLEIYCKTGSSSSTITIVDAQFGFISL